MGTDVFTYVHFPIIVGVILTALGIEQAMGHLDGPHLGVLGGWALGIGVALYVAGTVAAVVRARGVWSLPRCVVCLVVAAASPAIATAPPLAAVAVVAAALLALAAVESAAPPARPE